MLCQFSFQNFKSYKDETTFDFRAMAIPEFQDALIRQEKAEELLPVSADRKSTRLNSSHAT